MIILLSFSFVDFLSQRGNYKRKGKISSFLFLRNEKGVYLRQKIKKTGCSVYSIQSFLRKNKDRWIVKHSIRGPSTNSHYIFFLLNTVTTFLQRLILILLYVLGSSKTAGNIRFASTETNQPFSISTFKDNQN